MHHQQSGMKRQDLPLRYHTPEGWASTALVDIASLLDDHAHLERKAASNALELLNRWPSPRPPKNWATMLASVAKDEAAHLQRVSRLLQERGCQLSKLHRNPYAAGLRSLVRLGEGTWEVVDRLLVSALIELRSCERFDLLGEACEDPKLVKLYTSLWASEHGHFKTFLRLAGQIQPRRQVEERWAVMLEEEGRIIASQPPGPRIHSGLP